MFEEILPKGVADVIDEFKNCEDIALNFLVASHCLCQSAVYVKSQYPWIHHGKYNGLSTMKSHLNERHKCIHTFQKYFHMFPRRSTEVF